MCIFAVISIIISCIRQYIQPSFIAAADSAAPSRRCLRAEPDSDKALDNSGIHLTTLATWNKFFVYVSEIVYVQMCYVLLCLTQAFLSFDNLHFFALDGPQS